MQVAVLAGGLATRLGELAKNRPKSLVEICGRPFLEHQVEMLREGGVSDIVLCLGHLGERVVEYLGSKKYGVNIRFSLEDRPLGTAGALKKAAALLQDPFFVLYGDSYLFLNFSTAMDYFQNQDKLALMTVYKNQDRYDRSNTAVKGNLVAWYSKTFKTPEAGYIDYGANLFRKKVLDMVPEGRFYSLEELFPRLINMREMLAFEVKQRFFEIGSPHGLKQFERYVRGKR